MRAIKTTARGKVQQIAEGGSLALLKLWALQNVSGKGRIIVEDDERKVVLLVEGRGSGNFPKVTKNPPIEIHVATIEECGS